MSNTRLAGLTDPCFRLSVAFFLVFGLMLSGTASAEKLKLRKLPDNLGKNGLVTMQIGPHTTWRSAKLEFASGKMYEAHDGFFVAKLRPGTYTIHTIRAKAGWDSVKTAEVYDIVTVDRRFTVEAGKVTHLGLQYFLADPKNGRGNEERRYMTLAFKSQGPERAYLKEYYPALAATLSPDDVVLAAHEYADEKLQAVREILITYYAKGAYDALKSGRSVSGMRSSLPVEITASNFIIGDLGLVARAGSNGKFEYLETGTVSRIGQLEFPGDAPWFFSRTGTVYNWQGETLAPVSTLPDDFLPNNGALLGSGEAVLTDRRFRLLTSTNSGKSWSVYDELSLPENQSVSTSFSSGVNNVFAMATDPAYFFKKSATVTIDRKSALISELVLPKKVRNGIQGIYETDAGLFVHSQVRLDPTKLHFLRSGAREWVSNTVSTYFGCTISFPTRQGTEVRALCGTSQYPAYLSSKDFGASWEPIRPAVANKE